jgi:hypothetical protein
VLAPPFPCKYSLLFSAAGDIFFKLTCKFRLAAKKGGLL